jgi:hypothetical protein
VDEDAEIDSTVESSLRRSVVSVSCLEAGGGDGEPSRLAKSPPSVSSTTCVVSTAFCVGGSGEPVNNIASSSVTKYFNSVWNDW